MTPSRRATPVTPIPHVTRLSAAVHEAEAASTKRSTRARRSTVTPVIVLMLQIAVGLMIGANPLVMFAAAAAIVLAAYLVQVTKRRRAVGLSATESVAVQAPRPTSVQISPSSVATFEGGPLRSSAPAPDHVPPAAPVIARVQHLDDAPQSAPSAETSSTDAQPEHRPDLDWLWGTILPDPSARSQRRNDR
jgi:hypothetical protein